MSVYFNKNQTSNSPTWNVAFKKGVDAMKFYGGATVGMRTMVSL
jgi:hypothetical protein